MRLIDADSINFEEVFGGKSDFAKDLREAAQKLIDRQPTAFDKEKVIEELKHRRDWNDVDEKLQNHRDPWECAEIREHKGNYMAYDKAIEIIEKGGIG